jgi:hypothetical protein
LESSRSKLNEWTAYKMLWSPISGLIALKTDFLFTCPVHIWASTNLTNIRADIWIFQNSAFLLEWRTLPFVMVQD